MPEMHLRQCGFTYSASGPFTKNIEIFKTGDSWYIYRNELDKACFHHDMAYVYFKDLTRRTASNKIFRYEAFNIAKNQKYDGYKMELLQWSLNFLIKKLLVVVLKMRIF